MAGPIKPGELVLLIDSKKRRHLLRLQEGGEYHTHAGVVSHDEILGASEGCEIRSTLGARFTALRPTLAEYLLKMPRGAQIIYPKDIGPILVLADIFPGAKVLESGVGSGALSLALLRAIGATGFLHGYEIREDFATRAQRNIEGFAGTVLPLEIEVRDIYEGIELTDLDRIVLDLPEPWQVVKHAEDALSPGGILFSYLPSMAQVSRLHESLVSSSFGSVETIEVLQRGWHVQGLAVRPNHRMVGHTGFLTAARRYEGPSVPEV